MGFEDWKKTLPDAIIYEKFWSMIVYQKALYLYDLLWMTRKSGSRPRGTVLAKQIIGSSDSVCSISKKDLAAGMESNCCNFMDTRLALRVKPKRCYRARAFYQPDILSKRIKLASEVVALMLLINRQKNQ